MQVLQDDTPVGKALSAPLLAILAGLACNQLGANLFYAVSPLPILRQ